MRFSACGNIIEFGASTTLSVTSTPRSAGRQCMKYAWGPASCINLSSTCKPWYSLWCWLGCGKPLTHTNHSFIKDSSKDCSEPFPHPSLSICDPIFIRIHSEMLKNLNFSYAPRERYNITWKPWNFCFRIIASSFWPMLAHTSVYTKSAPITAAFGSCIISILLTPVLLAFSTVVLSGSKPGGHAQTKWNGITEARRNHECTILFPSPTYTTWKQGVQMWEERGRDAQIEWERVRERIETNTVEDIFNIYFSFSSMPHEWGFI